MTYAKDITQLVGRTPLVQINNLPGAQAATVLAKLEMFNPAASVKDRVALSIINAAEANGSLQKGGTIVEATSGNTGLGLAMIGAARGYKVIIAMPASMSQERRILMRAFGAELLLTEPSLGMQGAVTAAEQLAASQPGAVLASQFTNPANPAAHLQTGEEIWADTGGNIDIFVAGVGTGGTISGIGKAIRAHRPDLEIIAVEPAQSPLLSQSRAGAHKIQGIGANFVPQTLDQTIYSEVITVADDDALDTARRACAKEGLLVGISSGAALYAALQVAGRPENQAKTIVTLLPDTGERYLTTELFAELEN